MISLYGIFIATIIDDKAAGITPVSLTHIINNNSFEDHLTFLSGKVHINTDIGLATSIRSNTNTSDCCQYFARLTKSTCVPSSTKIDILIKSATVSLKCIWETKSVSGTQSLNTFLFPQISPVTNVAM